MLQHDLVAMYRYVMDAGIDLEQYADTLAALGYLMEVQEDG